MDDPYMPHDGPKTAYLTQRALASMRFFDWDPQAMRAPSQVGQDVLGDRGQNLSSVLKAICDEPGQKEALTEWLRVLTPMDVRDLEFPTDFAGRTLVHLVEPKGRRVSAHSASGGTLRFLALLAALMGPKAARFNVIEEIENGLHPTRLDLLVELLERQAAPDKQVVVTTHSPQLLRLLSPETMQHASLVYRLKDEGEGRIRRILDLPEAAAILDEHDPAWLFESGWLETTALFARDDDEARETPQPEPEPAAE
jgi:predicted ATPase